MADKLSLHELTQRGLQNLPIGKKLITDGAAFHDPTYMHELGLAPRNNVRWIPSTELFGHMATAFNIEGAARTDIERLKAKQGAWLREDFEPSIKMAGNIISNTFQELSLLHHITETARLTPIVKRRDGVEDDGLDDARIRRMQDRFTAADLRSHMEDLGGKLEKAFDVAISHSGPNTTAGRTMEQVKDKTLDYMKNAHLRVATPRS